MGLPGRRRVTRTTRRGRRDAGRGPRRGPRSRRVRSTCTVARSARRSRTSVGPLRPAPAERARRRAHRAPRERRARVRPGAGAFERDRPAAASHGAERGARGGLLERGRLRRSSSRRSSRSPGRSTRGSRPCSTPARKDEAPRGRGGDYSDVIAGLELEGRLLVVPTPPGCVRSRRGRAADEVEGMRPAGPPRADLVLALGAGATPRPRAARVPRGARGRDSAPTLRLAGVRSPRAPCREHARHRRRDPRAALGWTVGAEVAAGPLAPHAVRAVDARGSEGPRGRGADARPDSARELAGRPGPTRASGR